MAFDYFSKLWFKKNANELAINRASELLENIGVALPCEVVSVAGQMVEISFLVAQSPWTLPNVTIPCAGQSPWNYLPTQVGDTGLAVSATVFLGQLIGTVSSPATFQPPGNLGAMVFFPVGRKAFTPPNANAALLQGIDGVITQTTTGTASSVVTNQSGTVVTFGSNTVTVNSNGITMTGGGKTVTIDSSGVTIDGILFETHTHSAGTYVAGSSAVTGDSGEPT